MGEQKNIKDKIMEALYRGGTYRDIQLECSAPSKNFIKRVIKERDPELYSILNDTQKSEAWRSKQTKKWLDDEFEK